MASVEQNKQIVWNYLKSKGLTDEQASGIMGNIQHESGFDTSATNSFLILSSFTCSVISCITTITPAGLSFSSLNLCFSPQLRRWKQCRAQACQEKNIPFSSQYSVRQILKE